MKRTIEKKHERFRLTRKSALTGHAAFTSLVMACALALGWLYPTWAGATGRSRTPTIRLFPTTVVENIKATGETAKAMEDGLQAIISDLEQQMMLYRQSKCDGAEADPGCNEIVKQLGQKYMEMLDRMEAQLPKMETSVQATSDSLEKRIRQELGRKMTPRGLQKMLGGAGTPINRTRGQTRAGRLSEKFTKYYELVALGPRPGAGGSLAAVASEIYLDAREVKDLIALTRDEIGRSKLLVELNQAYGLITPEMFEMVAGVKGVIFGESEGGYGVPGPPPGSTKQDYRSPLEM